MLGDPLHPARRRHGTELTSVQVKRRQPTGLGNDRGLTGSVIHGLALVTLASSSANIRGRASTGRCGQ